MERLKYEPEDAVLVSIYLKDMADFQVLNRVYAQYMPELLPPARVCVSTQLRPDINVFITVVAHKLSRSQLVVNSSSAEKGRDVMHVQSISHWAPANIGPYSQCVKV